MPRPLLHLFAALIAGAMLSLAWLLPGTIACALFGWASVLLLLVILRGARPYLHCYLVGVISYAVAFHWLRGTIQNFGGFDPFAATLVFTLFVLVSSLQYIGFVFFARNLPSFIQRIAIAPALAWVFSELASIRIFPWQMGHTQLGFVPFAQIAEIGGTLLISCCMFVVAELALSAFRKKSVLRGLCAIVLLGAAVAYGISRVTTIDTLVASAPSQKIAIVQQNISIEEKHNIKFFARNTERYITASELLINSATDGQVPLIIWPESVVSDWVFAGAGNVINDPHLPQILSDATHFAPMLIGALTYDSMRAIHNSAVAIYPDGTVPSPYHKLVLMPFGEYTPFGNIFPFLKELNGTAAEFTPGAGVKVFEYPLQNRDLKVAPLICYEDLLPALSRNASALGAELLVNLTNDAWFGNTAAPLQHHLIAAFRAIENRRFLIRSTNSGLTAVVDPVGRTVSRLAPFSSGTLLADVKLISYNTMYQKLGGDWIWWLLFIVGGCGTCVTIIAKRIRTRTQS